MERKALKWETPEIFYLSTDKSHGAAECDNGMDFLSSNCDEGAGAQLSCTPGGAAGSSGVMCFGGSAAAVSWE